MMKRTKAFPRLVALLALTIVATACAGASETSTVEITAAHSDTEAVSTTFAPCIESGERVYEDAASYLARTTRWFEITAVVSAGKQDSVYEPPTPSKLEVRAVNPQGRPVGRTLSLELPLFPDQLPGVEWGTSSSNPVYVSVDETGNEEFPIDVIAVGVEVDDDFIFVGDCAEDGIGTPLRNLHAEGQRANFAVEMAKARGLTGRALGEFLSPTRDIPERGVSDRVLNPEDVDEDVLAALQFNAVVVDVLDAPRPGETLCLKSSAGWGDCLDLASTDPIFLEAFLEVRGNRQLEVWLTDEIANLDEPTARIGTVRIPNSLRDHDEVALFLSVDIQRNKVALEHSASLDAIDVSEQQWAALR